ncbi:MAG: ABC transporter substrate-binding protein [Clostridiales Family XIII bacterium]|jgi:ABC-type nitrate/sulfonate/bicarbonate transport system substrate-binding protein|nr:ABC transporter substrate-binding protein [Clostridiales Family XIII bacterium]
MMNIFRGCWRCGGTGRAVLIALAVALALAASGCSGSEGTESADSGSAGGIEKATVILDWSPNTNHTGMYVAKSLGYYEEAGLDVDIVQPAEGAAEQLVAVGQGDFGVSYQERVNYALTQDDPLPIRSIATIIQHNTSGFVSLPESGIETPADWAGKTYGGWGTPAEENVLRFIAGKYGIAYEDIDIVNLGEDDVITALKGDMDFAWVFEASDLINFQKQKVAYDYISCPSIDETLDYYTPILIANTKLIADNPEKVKAFTEATARGYEYAIEHPDEASAILLKEVPELDEYVVVEGQRYLSPRYAKDAPRWGWQEEIVWERYADLMYDNGELPRRLDLQAAFTNEFLPEAAEAR